MADLGYKRFIFTASQQATLSDLLVREHDRLMGGSAVERVLGRKYKGLSTSLRRQSARQSEYIVALAKASANQGPESPEVSV